MKQKEFCEKAEELFNRFGIEVGIALLCANDTFVGIV